MGYPVCLYDPVSYPNRGSRLTSIVPNTERIWETHREIACRDRRRRLCTITIGHHTQAARWIKFTSFREIAPMRSTLTDYVYEAIALEESGKKVELKKASEY